MSEAGDVLIQIEDLTKVFYTDEVETHALSGVHLAISKGEYVAMSGPSGCGKSTLLSIIGLLDTLWCERGLTLILVTHDSAIARRAQRIGVMAKGHLSIRQDTRA